jgi:hypothetical protein
MFATLPLVPVQAGPTEDEFLASYVGGWRGNGKLVGGEADEEFNCRVSVTPGSEGKINYAGRCSVAGLALSVAGTIAYIDDEKRFEAAMTSNASFSGRAIGVMRGSKVVFDLREPKADDGSDTVTISSQISLEGQSIGLLFTYVQKETGDTRNASVTFSKQ